MAAAFARCMVNRRTRCRLSCNTIASIQFSYRAETNELATKQPKFSVTPPPFWTQSKHFCTSDVIRYCIPTQSLGSVEYIHQKKGFAETVEHQLDSNVDDEYPHHATVFQPVNPDKGAQEMLLIRKPEQPENARCVRVSIIGSPNAGKSNLINAILGRRICAVSKKVHTTRQQAIAVLTERETQVIILDTPGMVSRISARRHSLPRELLVSPKSSLDEADLIVVVIDVADKWMCKKISTEILVELNKFQETPTVLVLNKVDILKNKQSLVELTAILTNGVVDGKPIEMSARLTKRLLKYKGFRRKYFQSRDSPENIEDKEPSESIQSETLQPEHISDKSSKQQSSEQPIDEEQQSSKQPIEEEQQSSEQPIEEEQQSSEQPIEEEILSRLQLGIIDDSNNITNRDGEDSSVNLSDCLSDKSYSSIKLDILQGFIESLDSLSRSFHFDRLTHEKDHQQNVEQLTENKKQREFFMEFSKQNGWDRFKKVFMVSAKTGDGIQDLKDFVMKTAKPNDWEYHKSVVTDLSPMEILEEAIREQLLEFLPEEVPYNIYQQNEYWGYGESGSLFINQKIICSKKSHLGMILRKIRLIAQRSEQDLMNAFHCEVVLRLNVKLSKK